MAFVLLALRKVELRPMDGAVCSTKSTGHPEMVLSEVGVVQPSESPPA